MSHRGTPVPEEAEEGIYKRSTVKKMRTDLIRAKIEASHIENYKGIENIEDFKNRLRESKEHFQVLGFDQFVKGIRPTDMQDFNKELDKKMIKSDGKGTNHQKLQRKLYDKFKAKYPNLSIEKVLETPEPSRLAQKASIMATQSTVRPQTSIDFVGHRSTFGGNSWKTSIDNSKEKEKEKPLKKANNFLFKRKTPSPPGNRDSPIEGERNAYLLPISSTLNQNSSLDLLRQHQITEQSNNQQQQPQTLLKKSVEFKHKIMSHDLPQISQAVVDDGGVIILKDGGTPKFVNGSAKFGSGTFTQQHYNVNNNASFMTTSSKKFSQQGNRQRSPPQNHDHQRLNKTALNMKFHELYEEFRHPQNQKTSKKKTNQQRTPSRNNDGGPVYTRSTFGNKTSENKSSNSQLMTGQFRDNSNENLLQPINQRTSIEIQDFENNNKFNTPINTGVRKRISMTSQYQKRPKQTQQGYDEDANAAEKELLERFENNRLEMIERKKEVVRLKQTATNFFHQLQDSVEKLPKGALASYPIVIENNQKTEDVLYPIKMRDQKKLDQELKNLINDFNAGLFNKKNKHKESSTIHSQTYIQ